MPSTKTLSPNGFARFELPEALNRGIESLGFTSPRPIQAETIPASLEGRDILGLAQTGTGKTAAFALPILDLLIDQPGPGPRALILAPTRELATQIATEIRALGRFVPVQVVTIFGGVAQSNQVRALRQNPQIVVGCPGRVLDLLEQRALRLDKVEVLVLDEADHMFDMGFLPDVRRILGRIPKERQNLLFSATMPKEVRHLADEILHEPHVVELASASPADTIDHAIVHVAEGRKRDLLEHMLKSEGFTSAIVFTRTKQRAKRLAVQLDREGHRAVGIQGNLSQNQRERAMGGFRSGRFDVLVATDIVARGIDVSGVSHVINFDVPTTPEAYTHRIGRTGRAEKEGTAFTFVTGGDASWVRATERMIGAPIARRTVDGFDVGNTNEPAPPKQGRGQRPQAQGGSRPRSQGVGTGRPARAANGTPARQGNGNGAGTGTGHGTGNGNGTGQSRRGRPQAAAAVGSHPRPKPKGKGDHPGRPGGKPKRPAVAARKAAQLGESSGEGNGSRAGGGGASAKAAHGRKSTRPWVRRRSGGGGGRRRP